MQRHHRLRRSEDFARLRQEGYTVQNRWILCSVIPNGLSHNRYGFVTPKRLGKATIRNRVRRLMREAIRSLQARFLTGYDVSIVARQSIVGQPYDEVLRSLSELCCQVGLLKTESSR
jgi:ribonuclease P protein component